MHEFPRTDRERSSARTAGTWLLVRATVASIGALNLVVAGGAVGRPLSGPVLAHVLLAVAALVCVPVVRAGSDDASARWTRVWIAVDVAFYAGYSAAFHGRPGAGTAYAVLVLLMGPLLWGWRGLPVTALPVGVVATVWPQLDVLGAAPGVWQTWLLVVLFASPTAGLASFVRRGGVRLAVAEQQFRAAFDHASSGMALLDDDLRVVRANRALHRLLGADDLTGQQLSVHAVDPGAFVVALGALCRERPAVRFEGQLTRSDGQLRWAGVVASAVPSGRQVVVQVEDVTDQRTMQEQLTYQATHDLLTGLPNPRVLHARLDAALAGPGRPAVLFLDLDRFKLVNDSLGHGVGDQLLIQASQRLLACVRPGDVVARLSGDEFVLLCEDVDASACLDVAERVVGALRPVFQLPEGMAVATASVGIALAGPTATCETLLRDADTAMYAAKREGGDRAVLFAAHLRQDVLERRGLEISLRDALTSDGLALRYQPVVDEDGRIVAAEALLRWQGTGRPVSPVELVDVAEQSGLIGELGLWVLRRAMRDAEQWPASVRLHVNVSPRQLTDDFPARVREHLDRWARPAGSLCLEVTETALGGDVDSLVARLEALRALGVTLAVDDFGTGHASLTYLARLPVQEIKVDRSFVTGLPGDRGSAAILAGVLAMSRAYGMEVVAEGVETEAQDREVLRLGCALRQGFLHHRPVTRDALGRLLSTVDAGRS